MQPIITDAQQRALQAALTAAQHSITLAEVLDKPQARGWLKDIANGGYVPADLRDVLANEGIEVKASDLQVYFNVKARGRGRRKKIEPPPALKQVTLTLEQVASVEAALNEMANNPKGLTTREYLAQPEVFGLIEALLNLGRSWEVIAALYNQHGPKEIAADTLRRYFQQIKREKQGDAPAEEAAAKSGPPPKTDIAVDPSQRLPAGTTTTQDDDIL